MGVSKHPRPTLLLALSLSVSGAESENQVEGERVRADPENAEALSRLLAAANEPPTRDG